VGGLGAFLRRPSVHRSRSPWLVESRLGVGRDATDKTLISHLPCDYRRPICSKLLQLCRGKRYRSPEKPCKPLAYNPKSLLPLQCTARIGMNRSSAPAPPPETSHGKKAAARTLSLRPVRLRPLHPQSRQRLAGLVAAMKHARQMVPSTPKSPERPMDLAKLVKSATYEAAPDRVSGTTGRALKKGRFFQFPT
jgi:hypothetical protein